MSASSASKDLYWNKGISATREFESNLYLSSPFLSLTWMPGKSEFRALHLSYLQVDLCLGALILQ